MPHGAFFNLRNLSKFTKKRRNPKNPKIAAERENASQGKRRNRCSRAPQSRSSDRSPTILQRTNPRKRLPHDRRGESEVRDAKNDQIHPSRGRQGDPRTHRKERQLLLPSRPGPMRRPESHDSASREAGDHFYVYLLGSRCTSRAPKCTDKSSMRPTPSPAQRVSPRRSRDPPKQTSRNSVKRCVRW